MRIINVTSNTNAYVIIRNLNLKPGTSGTIDVDILVLSELKSLRNLSMANDIIISESDFNYVADKIASMSGGTGGDAPVKSVNTEIGDVVLDAADVGAPTSTYVNEQLDTKANSIAVTQALSTKADLVGGVIPANQLPSFVDDVLEYPDLGSFPVVGEASKIYIALDTNKTYRWSGSSYVEIGGGVALGETALTAYRGDRGKVAYDHSLSQGNPHNTTTSEITEGTNKYFTDLRVRNTVLSGLVKTDSSNVTNADTIEIAVGKLATKSEAGGTVTTWVDASTLTGYAKNNNLTAATTKVQFAKINGFIWMRGYITTSNSINVGASLFSFTDSRFLWDNTYLGTSPDNQFTYENTMHKNIKIQELAEFRLLAKQIGTGTTGNITHRLYINADVNITSAINFAIIEPVCIGIAKNP